MIDLTKIKLRHSPLTDTIYLCRFGKDPAIALDKREAEADAVSAVVAHMTHDAPNGAKKGVCVDGKWYELRVTLIAEEPNGPCCEYHKEGGDTYAECFNFKDYSEPT